MEILGASRSTKGSQMQNLKDSTANAIESNLHEIKELLVQTMPVCFR